MGSVTQIVVRRALQMRRAACENRDVGEIVMNNLKKYVGEVGA